jgi:hypothetical protein
VSLQLWIVLTPNSSSEDFVDRVVGIYGPSGEAGGSQCFLKSNISGPGNPYKRTAALPIDIHTAKLSSDPGMVQSPPIVTLVDSAGSDGEV